MKEKVTSVQKAKEDFDDYMGDMKYKLGVVQSLLHVVKASLSAASDSDNNNNGLLVCGCEDLVDKIIEDARTVSIGIDVVTIQKELWDKLGANA